MYRLFLFCIMGVLTVSSPALVTASSDVALVESFDHGLIDWGQGTIEASGLGPFSSPAGAQSMAKRAAIDHLITIIRSIRVDSRHLIGDLIDRSPLIGSKILAMAEDAEITSQKYRPDQSVQVTLRTPLYGGLAQLILPEEIQQIDPVHIVGPPPADNAQNDQGTIIFAEENAWQPYTGLVIDARGVPLKPAMAPKIFNESGREVFGAAYASREFAVQQGLCLYFRRIEAAAANARVQPRPLIVKALRARFSDLVISNTDAAILRRDHRHLNFLKQCRVMIVTD